MYERAFVALYEKGIVFLKAKALTENGVRNVDDELALVIITFCGILC